MNRRWKNVLIVFLVMLMLLAITGTAVAHKNHNNWQLEDYYGANNGAYCQWTAYDVYAVKPNCIGNFSMY